VADSPEVPFLDLRAADAELRPRLDAALRRVLDRSWYLLGEELKGFEAEFGAYVGAPHVLGVGNGLDALTLALEAVGVGPGDRVLVPSVTFVATWLAVSAVGAEPVPVEPLAGSWGMDPAAAEAACGPRVKAMVPVHLFGQPADLEPLLAVAKRHGLAVVEDAAQAHGSRYRGRRVGAHGDAVAWSFYPGKNLGALGDGGAVSTARADVAEKVALLRNYGSRVKYNHEIKGRNTRLDEIQAAVLRDKLTVLDACTARRAAVAAAYAQGLAGVPDLGLPAALPGTDGVWHLYVVQHPRRDALRDWLRSRGVETLIHYPVPPHRSGAYAADRPWPALPIAEAAAARSLSLPMGPHLREEQVARVIDALRAFR
jgi:dTDP-4-amino-4,6-dideoxygalactose transaminase